MSNEEKLLHYAKIVMQMRDAQKEYFKAARKGSFEDKKTWIEISKKREKLVDEQTAIILSKGEDDE